MGELRRLPRRGVWGAACVKDAPARVLAFPTAAERAQRRTGRPPVAPKPGPPPMPGPPPFAGVEFYCAVCGLAEAKKPGEPARTCRCGGRIFTSDPNLGVSAHAHVKVIAPPPSSL